MSLMMVVTSCLNGQPITPDVEKELATAIAAASPDEVVGIRIALEVGLAADQQTEARLTQRLAEARQRRRCRSAMLRMVCEQEQSVSAS